MGNMTFLIERLYKLNTHDVISLRLAPSVSARSTSWQTLTACDLSVDDDQIQTLNEAMAFMEMVTHRLELVDVDYDPELLAQMEHRACRNRSLYVARTTSTGLQPARPHPRGDRRM